jgi:hypothetical protein
VNGSAYFFLAELLLLELLLLAVVLELELFDPPDLDADLAILSSLRPLKPLRSKRGSGPGRPSPCHCAGFPESCGCSEVGG